ncbi:MAG: RNA-directed DNA polymerase [Candidatus Saccharimonadales bacterium]
MGFRPSFYINIKSIRIFIINEKEKLTQLLYEAYLKARLAKRGTADEQRFEMCLTMNLSQLCEEICARNYKPSRGITFIIRNPVIREIFAAPFRDRVVHHLLYDFVAAWWDKRFIYDNYSCRMGKGTLFGVDRLRHHMMSASQNGQREAWVLKLDIQGYFMSLPREKLYERAVWGLLRQYGEDAWEYKLCKYLWKEVIFDDPTEGVQTRGSKRNWDDLPKSKSLFHAKPGSGIVIGNLTSQLLSNIYLDQLDRFVQHELKFKHYGRYVDDFYVISTDKARLLEIVPIIDEYLTNIGLNLHPKKRFLQEMHRGVPFLGAVVYPHRIHPGRRTKANFNKAARNYYLAGGNSLDKSAPEAVSFTSYHGLTMHYKHRRMWGKSRRHDAKPPFCSA